MRYSPEWYAGPDYRTRLDAIIDYIGDRHPKHILDFGALTTQTALELADRYGAHVIVVDDTLSETGGVEVINRKLGPSQIRKLPYQDVTLCLSVLHHLSQYRSYLDALQWISGLLFIETAHPDEDLPLAGAHHKTPKIIAELEHRGAKPLCTTPGYDPRFERTLWVLT